MKKLLYAIIITVFFSCNNERVLKLPEIENAEITEVLDVSPAYIFYDETQPDSTLFNRKNLIGTTNWLVNVDKRLTLKQAIPHIQYLQDKRKKASMHKNENAKNYFTCNDTSVNNLGFVEFTDINFITDINILKNDSLEDDLKSVLVHFITSEYVAIWNNSNDQKMKEEVIKIDSLFTKTFLNEYENNNIQFQLVFSKGYSFQKYINLKTKLNEFLNQKVELSKHEIFY